MNFLSRRHHRSVPAALLLLLGAAGALQAQHGEPPRPAGYALTNLTLVRADGSVTEGVTAVVRGEFVRVLEAGAETPAGVRVLEGDSLYMYPGLVDAEGPARHEFPSGEATSDDGPDRREVPAWNPSREQQGFTPRRRVVEHLKVEEDELEKARKAGVVASADHPSDGLMPGRGALLLHRGGTGAPRDLVLRPALGPVMAFDGASGVYPSTLFGVIAFLRQRFEDARRHARIVSVHREDPSGRSVPRWDPDLQVVEAALEGAFPVYFRAHRAEDIRRVLEMSGRHGFRPVIVGGREAWRVADRLRERDVPVLVSLDFPKAQRWKPDEAVSDTAGETPEELEPEVQREKERIEAAYANAGRLAEAGVRFALTSGGGDAELLEGARKAVEYGLSREDAVAALTRRPARLLGAGRLTDLEPGQPATFVVADGPLFEEDTELAYTFVEGRLEEMRREEKEPTEPPAADLTGTWQLEMEGATGSFSATMRLEQEGGRFEGTLRGEFGTFDVVDGLVSGTEVSFTVVADMGGETAEFPLTGTVEDDEISGTGSGPPGMGSFTWEATREGPGGGRR